MPLFDEYREQLKSEIADLTNTGGRPAGSITAAMFLKEFTGGLPWVHIDIAGTAWADEAKPYLPKGPSGVAVRTLAELAFDDSWLEGAEGVRSSNRAPIIVKRIEPSRSRPGWRDVLLGALGSAPACWSAAAVCAGVVDGGLMFWFDRGSRRRTEPDGVTA